MKHIHSLSFASAALGCLTTMAPGALVLRWKLDDTGSTFAEEVSGQTTTAVAVETVATGQSALAPDGGVSIALTNTDPGSYIDAGTVQSNGTYAAGIGDGTFKLLSSWTVTGWAKITNTGLSDQVIVSSDWNSTTGWSMASRNDTMIFDYGNSRLSSTAGLVDGVTYLFVARCDPGKTVFGGGTNSASIAWWDGTTWTETQGTQNRSIRLQGLEIGSFNNGDRELTGGIDDVRIYDHVLTQTEMNALAVPEPGVAMLVGLAGCGLGLRRRRPRQRPDRHATDP